MKRNIVGTVFFATFMLGLAAIAPAQDGPSCSNASLAGAWGYTETGTVIAPAPTGPVPAAAVGRYTFDRAGAFSGTQYSSTGGTINEDTKQGTYTVDPDCTGTLTLSVYNQSGILLRSSVWAIVLVNKATEFRGIMLSLTLPNGLQLPPIMTMTGTRLFPGRGDGQEE
jgi:hypothetical protein